MIFYSADRVIPLIYLQNNMSILSSQAKSLCIFSLSYKRCDKLGTEALWLESSKFRKGKGNL